MVKVNENSTNNIVGILKGSIISILLTLILLMIFSVILTYSNVSENAMPTVIIIITAFSILLGSQITTRKIKKNGILNGAIVGTIYILLLYLISSVVTNNFALGHYSIIMIITSILTGGLGGIIGVNLKNS